MMKDSHNLNTKFEASSFGVARFIFSPECETGKNLRQGSSQANLKGNHTYLNNWTKAVPSVESPFYFPSMLTYSCSEREAA